MDIHNKISHILNSFGASQSLTDTIRNELNLLTVDASLDKVLEQMSAMNSEYAIEIASLRSGSNQGGYDDQYMRMSIRSIQLEKCISHLHQLSK